MKAGTLLRANSLVATSTCGFTLGLDPPEAGKAWQLPQESELKPGPRPASPLAGGLRTKATSSNTAFPCWKNRSWPAVRPAKGVPAAAAPARTPGSRAPWRESCEKPVSGKAIQKASPNVYERDGTRTLISVFGFRAGKGWRALTCDGVHAIFAEG